MSTKEYLDPVRNLNDEKPSKSAELIDTLKRADF